MLGSMYAWVKFSFSNRGMPEKLCIEMEIFTQAGGKVFPTF